MSIFVDDPIQANLFTKLKPTKHKKWKHFYSELAQNDIHSYTIL